MSQNTYVKFYYTISVLNSLNSHVSSVSIDNELNFSYWNEQVQFHFGVLDLDDLVILEKKIVDITHDSNTKEKVYYKA